MRKFGSINKILNQINSNCDDCVTKDSSGIKELNKLNGFKNLLLCSYMSIYDHRYANFIWKYILLLTFKRKSNTIVVTKSKPETFFHRHSPPLLFVHYYASPTVPY